MDAPVKEIKKAFSLEKMLTLMVGLLVLLAIADFAGITNWIFYPVTSFKNKFLTKSVTATTGA